MSSSTVAAPPELFVGVKRTCAVILYYVISISSIILHTLFIMGIKKLRGWKANFSFTLLIFLSTMALVYFSVHMISCVTALFYMNWEKYQFLWIFLGSLAISSYYTVVLLNLVIALHRIYYTVFPFQANRPGSVVVEKITTTGIGIIFVTTVIIFNTQLIGFRWVASLMSFSPTKSRVSYVILNKISNYLIGVVNLIAYAILLFTLIKRKMLSFSRSHEIKMTLQVSFMMIAEMIFFCYWEFANVHGYGAWDLVIAEISVLLFFDVLVLPYMILNRSFHAEMKRLFKPCDRKGERTRQLRMSVVTTAT
ncbi:hypothetical protein V3C99_013978 [Haemonchus contortus]